MQKKTLVLALMSALSAPAFAQSNVQIYGVLDYGYSYRYDKLPGNHNVASSNSRIDSGLDLGPRLGFKGTEDLGNGLKAFFVLERGFFLDTGADIDGFNRQAYVGLAGDWGTLVGGRIYSPYYNLISSIDPFEDGTVGNFSNVKGDVQSLFNPVRVNNTIAYTTPSWGGLSFTAAYSNNAGAADVTTKTHSTTTSNVTRTTTAADGTVTTNVIGTQTVDATVDNTRVAGITANYANNGLLLGLSYHLIDVGARNNTVTVDTSVTPNRTTIANSDIDTIQNVTLGGSYDCGFAKVGLAWSWDKLKYTHGARTVGNRDYDQNNFLLGAVVPFGNHSVKASFNYSKGEKFIGDAWQFALGYAYRLSKRTNFYASYALIDNDEASLTRTGRTAVPNDSYNSGGVYQQAIQFGVTHRF